MSTNPTPRRRPLTTFVVPEAPSCGSCGWYSPEVAPDRELLPRGAAWCLNAKSPMYRRFVEQRDHCAQHTWARAATGRINWLAVALLFGPWIVVAAVVAALGCTALPHAGG
jgi:hypothetical protein